MQTKRNKVARSPPTEEIRDIFRVAWNDIKQRDPEYAVRCERGEQPIYWSLDNAPVHKSAMEGWDDWNGWRVQAGIPGTVIWAPPYSPDLHQVIEHAHANTLRKFQGWLISNVHQKPFPQVLDYFDVIAQCFLDGNEPDSIEKNVAKLTKVYERVIEAHGDHIAPAWR